MVRIVGQHGMRVIKHGYCPSMEGWVSKRKKLGWNSIDRYLRIRNGVLYHYTDPKIAPTWRLVLYQTYIETNPREATVYVEGYGRKVTFSCEDRKYLRRWAATLEACSHAKLGLFYDVDGFITRGSYGTINKATNMQTGVRVAVKQIQVNLLSKYERRLVDNEVRIMSEQRHQNLMRALDVFETLSEINIVMPIMHDGSLYTLQETRGAFSESFARICVRSVLLGLAHLHQRSIVHRDIKPGNILCDNIDERPVIKIADFGVSEYLGGTGILRNPNYFLGAPGYHAPEILLSKKSNEKIDMWACGVLMYKLLSNSMPYKPESISDIRERPASGDYVFSDFLPWQLISDEAKDLIRGLLEIDPVQRLSAQQALRHSWFSCTLE